MITSFSLFAVSIASFSFPILKRYVSNPFVLGLRGTVFAWMLIKTFPFSELAMWVLFHKGTKTSSSLVCITVIPEFFSNPPRCLAIERVTSFSFKELTPIAPGSFPPWPASITMVSISHLVLS